MVIQLLCFKEQNFSVQYLKENYSNKLIIDYNGQKTTIDDVGAIRYLYNQFYDLMANQITSDKISKYGINIVWDDDFLIIYPHSEDNEYGYEFNKDNENVLSIKNSVLLEVILELSWISIDTINGLVFTNDEYDIKDLLRFMYKTSMMLLRSLKRHHIIDKSFDDTINENLKILYKEGENKL